MKNSHYFSFDTFAKCNNFSQLEKQSMVEQFAAASLALSERKSTCIGMSGQNAW